MEKSFVIFCSLPNKDVKLYIVNSSSYSLSINRNRAEIHSSVSLEEAKEKLKSTRKNFKIFFCRKTTRAYRKRLFWKGSKFKDIRLHIEYLEVNTGNPFLYTGEVR